MHSMSLCWIRETRLFIAFENQTIAYVTLKDDGGLVGTRCLPDGPTLLEFPANQIIHLTIDPINICYLNEPREVLLISSNPYFQACNCVDGEMSDPYFVVTKEFIRSWTIPSSANNVVAIDINKQIVIYELNNEGKFDLEVDVAPSNVVSKFRTELTVPELVPFDFNVASLTEDTAPGGPSSPQSSRPVGCFGDTVSCFTKPKF